MKLDELFAGTGLLGADYSRKLDTLMVIEGPNDEPFYHQGQILLLQKRSTFNKGDHIALTMAKGGNLIGIFEADYPKDIWVKRFRHGMVIDRIPRSTVKSYQKIVATFSADMI